jgi:cytochrome b561
LTYGWIGVTISFHLLWTLRTIWKQYSGSPGKVTVGNGQSDIAKNGLLLSSLYILVVGLAIWGVTFAALLEGYSGALL